MDDRQVLEQLERHVSQDDPRFAATLRALNERFTSAPTSHADMRSSPSSQDPETLPGHSWAAVAAFIAVVMVMCLLLVVILHSGRHPAEQDGNSARALTETQSLTFAPLPGDHGVEA